MISQIISAIFSEFFYAFATIEEMLINAKSADYFRKKMRFNNPLRNTYNTIIVNK